MKKIVIAIIVVGTILGVVLGVMGVNLSGDGTLNDDIETQTTDDFLDQFSELDDFETVDEQEIEEDTESENDEEEPLFEEEFESDEPEDTRRLIPKRTPLSTYSGAFVKFSYDASLKVSDETLNSFILEDAEGNTVATFDIYTNEENLPPYDFVTQADNLINYYAESEKNNVVPEEIFLVDDLHAVKFGDFPGVVEQDIYLVMIDGYVVKVSVQSMKESVFNTTILTIENA